MQVNAATVRTVTRTFGWANGVRTLVQVTEEESQGLPGEDSKVVRATSSPDVNGNLQLVQRESEETKKTGKDADETKTTVMRPNRMGARQEVEFGGWPRFAPRFWALTLRLRSGQALVSRMSFPRCLSLGYPDPEPSTWTRFPRLLFLAAHSDESSPPPVFGMLA